MFRFELSDPPQISVHTAFTHSAVCPAYWIRDTAMDIIRIRIRIRSKYTCKQKLPVGGKSLNNGGKIVYQ